MFLKNYILQLKDTAHVLSMLLTALVVFFLLSLPTKLAAKPQPATAEAVSEDSCRRIVERICEMHYKDPANKQMVDLMLGSFDVLREQKNKKYYFQICNMYVDWFFRHGDMDKTKIYLDRVCRLAETTPMPELKAIARRAQGQFMLRLGLTSLASSYIHEAMRLCPNYKSVVAPDTYLSIGLQVISIYMKEQRVDSADIILRKVERGYKWHCSNGYVDSRNWMRARLLAMHADVEMERGNMKLCGEWMKKCRQVMMPGTSMSYYAPYYIIRTNLDMREGRYGRALETVDSLLAIGPEVRPLTSRYLLMRAQLLNKLGRAKESADAYDTYLKESDRIDRLLTAERIEQLRAHYEYDKAVADRKAAEHDRILMVFALAVLTAMFVVVVWAMTVLRRKNRHLVRLLRGNHNGYTGEVALQQDVTTDAERALGAKGVAFLTSSQAYRDVDGGRAALVVHLGVGERAAVSAVATYTGCSFKTFTNMLKLEESRRLLEQNHDMTIAAIASQCGFGTLRTYQNLFKEKYGLSPSQYRDSLVEDDE